MRPIQGVRSPGPRHRAPARRPRLASRPAMVVRCPRRARLQGGHPPMSRLRIVQRPGSPFLWITGTVGGCRIRESTRTTDRRSAEQFAAARETEIYRAALHGAPKPRVTFTAAVNSYLDAGNHSPSTMARIARLVRHIGPKVPCDDVGQERLDLACRALLRPGSKPATGSARCSPPPAPSCPMPPDADGAPCPPSSAPASPRPAPPG